MATRAKDSSDGSLKKLARAAARTFLQRDDVTSVGIGYKKKNGRATDALSVQLTVAEKVGLETLEAIDVEPLPTSFQFDGAELPTDVIERSFDTAARAISVASKIQSAAERKSAVNPVVPGVSIAHRGISAGTAGCVVYDAASSEPYVLSNWHVLHGPDGEIGDDVVQPGRHDDNRVSRNVVGELVRSHLGAAGDCAIARIDERSLEDDIIGLGVRAARIGEADLGDRVVKSGRTTGVTHGIVSRIHVTTRLNYGSASDPLFASIGGFEIEPDPRRLPHDGEISMGGDSGSAWMAVERGRATDLMVGLHFAGEVGNAREHALACNAGPVFEKLAILPAPSSSVSVESVAGGYDAHFLGRRVFRPKARGSARTDLLTFDGRTERDYTHFSLAMSRSRRLATWVAWNIDGARLRRLSRSGIRFRKDRDVGFAAQIGNELYRNNDLDRGHIARRADLTWGSRREADRANRDSFFYTNIAPQHEAFNQSGAGGVWGEIENAIFSDVELEDLRVSVMAGPIFSDNDPEYRGEQIPQAFWKVIYFKEAGQDEVRARAYILGQTDLLTQLEVLELPEFGVFEVSINEVQARTGLDLFNARAPSRSGGGSGRETVESEYEIRRIHSATEIVG